MMRPFLIIRLLFAFTYVNSQPFNWTGKENCVSVANYIEFLEDKESNLTIQQIGSGHYDNLFKSSNQSVLHFGFNKSVYWLKLNTINPTKDNLILELSQAFIPNADFYFKNPDGGWAVYRAGYKVNLKDKILKDHFQEFPLYRGNHEYFIRIIPSIHPIPVRIWKAGSYELNLNKQRLIYGIYIGILLFAIGINVFLFFALRKNYYLLYSILIFFYLLTAAGVMEGFIIYIFPNFDLTYSYKVIPVIDMPAFLFYCISFLELKNHNRRLYNFCLAFCLCLILYLIGVHFLPQLLVFLINYISALAVFILAIYIGINVGKKGNSLGYYFAVAYCIWLLLILLDEIYIQTGKPSHIFELSYVSIAIFMEAFLLALLLAKRFQWDKKKDENARFELQKNMIVLQQEFKEELLNAQLEMQEQTFLNISQEIHDNIGQTLSLAKLNLAILPPPLIENDKTRLFDSKKLLAKAINDLRDLAKTLNSDYIGNVGLVKVIEQQVDLIRKIGIYQLDMSVDGEVESYGMQKELLIFRIVQELLNNIIKHAKADSIIVRIKFGVSQLLINISDNGIGFDLKELNTSQPKGLGINNIVNRIKIINGKISINSSLLKGTEIEIHIPR